MCGVSARVVMPREARYRHARSGQVRSREGIRMDHVDAGITGGLLVLGVDVDPRAFMGGEGSTALRYLGHTPSKVRSGWVRADGKEQPGLKCRAHLLVLVLPLAEHVPEPKRCSAMGEEGMSGERVCCRGSDGRHDRIVCPALICGADRPALAAGEGGLAKKGSGLAG
jgi:hypothetical protein